MKNLTNSEIMDLTKKELTEIRNKRKKLIPKNGKLDDSELDVSHLYK